MAHKHPNSPTRLTEFAPLCSEVKPSGNFLSRLFKKKTTDDNQLANDDNSLDGGSLASEAASLEYSQSGHNEAVSEDNSVGSESSSLDTPSSEALGGAAQLNSGSHQRTLNSVLNRLSNILDRRSQTPQAYKDSDFRQYWMPDSNCRECYECGDRFNTFRRRHHCRVCGQIFCSHCCNQEVPGRIMGYTGYLRVCTYCCKIVLSYAQNPDASGDLRSLNEDLQKQMSIADLDAALGPGASSSNQDLWTPTLRRKSARTSKSQSNSIFDEERHKQQLTDATSPPATHNPFDVSSQAEFSILERMQAERRMLLKDSVELRDLWQQLRNPGDGLELQSHRHRLRTYHNCLVGSQLADWMLSHDKATSREQAVVLCQALLDAQWLAPISHTNQPFRDEYALYRPGKTAVSDSPDDVTPLQDTVGDDDDDAEPLWVKEIHREDTDSDNTSLSEYSKIPATVTAPDKLDATSRSVFYVGRTESAENRKAKKLKNATSPFFSDKERSIDDYLEVSKLSLADGLGVEVEETDGGGWRHLKDLREENGELLAYERLSKAQDEHMGSLTRQLLTRMNVPQKWADTLRNIMRKVSQLVKPDVRNEGDSMDIRQYVQVKKIVGGSRSHTSIVSGVVFSKNIAHKKMKHHIINPKILLLRGAIEYQRVENKFSSLEPQILQEYEYLRNCVGRIAALEPDIVLVERTVSRVAQEFILDAGITLIINVKPSVMERVARFTQADIITSIDSLASRSALGFCNCFKAQIFSIDEHHTKNLLYFDGCPTQLGCTVTLRGAQLAELRNIKRILLFMIYMAYHARLEMAFLMDEFALPPARPEESELLMAGSPGNSPLTEIPQKELPKISSKQIDNIEDQEDETSLFTIPAESDNSVFPAAPVMAFIEKEDMDLEAAIQRDTKMAELSKPQTLLENKSERKDTLLDPSKTEVEDFSDPLQSYLRSEDDTIFASNVSFREEKQVNQGFKKALKDVILSVSPYMKYSVPYLETEEGTKCKLRKYLPSELYWSESFNEKTEQKSKAKAPEKAQAQPDQNCHVKITSPHAFVMKKLTASLDDTKTQALLADFRARGGTIQPSQCAGWNVTPGVQSYTRQKSEKNDTENTHSQIDCLNIFNQQSIRVLFSSYCTESANAPHPCVQPWVVSMDFYGRNDISLGGFLERYCFRDDYACPNENCGVLMTDHTRRFVHEQGMLSVVMKRIESAIPGYENSILMWAWCRNCRQVTPVVPMSGDTWSLSFAKYLQIRFYGDQYNRRGGGQTCTHSLHHQHHQYFGYRNIVVSFKYGSVDLNAIELPPMVTGIRPPLLPHQSLMDQTKHLHYHGTSVFSSVMEHLHRLKRDSQTDMQLSFMAEYITRAQGEKEVFRDRMEKIQSLLPELTDSQTCPPPSPQQNQDDIVSAIQDLLVSTQHLIAEAVSTWNNRILDIVQQMKKVEKLRSQQPAYTRVASKDTVIPASSDHVVETLMDTPPSKAVDSDTVEGDVTFFVVSTSSAARDTSTPTDIRADNAALVHSEASPGSLTATPHNLSPDNVNTPAGSAGSSGSGGKGHQRSWSAGDDKKIIKQVDLGEPPLERRGTMKNLISSLLSTAGANPVSSPFGPGEHHGVMLPGGQRIPIVVYDQEPSSIIAYALGSVEYVRQLEELRAQLPKEIISGGSGISAPHPLMEAIEQTDLGKKGSVLSFFRGAGREKSTNPQVGMFDAVKYTPQLDIDSLEETDETDFALFAGIGESRVLSGTNKQAPVNYNIELQFNDNTARFFCRVYYVEQFRNLRKLIFPAGEDRFVRSLSRCFTWLARGGKSGSTFCKTQDDRFILKQMSRYEVQSFVEFAPHYFQYVTKAYNEKKPTMLAKILGVYRIGFRNSQTTEALKQDLLVMENLFYNRNISQIFDLKGSMRNRLVNISGKRVEDLVLLDENLLKLSIDQPLYVRPHSKAVVMMAMTEDTRFLSRHLVMDYSLLVGLDEASGQLVVGIIDYIRTFTWDKKLEMLVKSQLVGPGKMPTVVSPELYRGRFLDAMDRYFLQVPDKWTGLSCNPDI